MKHDIAHETLEWPRRLLAVAFVVIGAWYLSWRPTTFNPDAALFSWLVYGAELFGFATALLHIFMCWKLSVRRAPPPRPGLTVDVLVPTYDESVDVVRKTLLAAQAMEYAHRTWLLDDGRRPAMAQLAREIGCDYLSRPDNQHAKAGNLNHALAHTTGELVVVFDADHAPRRDFLVKTLGYFTDEQVAFVQTPQDYFNLDSFQHRKNGSHAIWTEQSLFFRIIQRGKDCWNAAFFCGSCAVIRRGALERIGGFATGTVTEDLHTSIRMHAAGFRSVYHAEPLAFGVAPESIAPFIGQRVRWGQGAMHVWRRERILTNRGLTLAQRLNYLASVATYFDGWQKAIFYFAPVVVLATGVLPLLTSTPEFLLHFLPYYALTFWIFEEVGRGYGRTLFIEQYNMARFAAFAWATVAWLLPNGKFRVTPKGLQARRALRFTLPQWAVMSLNLAAIPAGIALYMRGSPLPLDGLVANVLWASVNAALALAVLTFTAVMQKRRRHAYRFAVPVAAEIDCGGEITRGTVDDLSDSGLRYYGRLPEGLAPGSRFTGYLNLPRSRIHISGEVRALIPLHGHESVPGGFGASFEVSRQDHYELERFLFGSDLQWLLNGYSDQVQTPLSRLFPATVHGPDPTLLAGLRWNAAAITGTGMASPVTAVVSTTVRGGAGRWLASFTELPEREDFALEIFDRSGSRRGVVRARRAGLAPTGDLMLYRLETSDAGLIAEPEIEQSRVAA